MATIINPNASPQTLPFSIWEKSHHLSIPGLALPLCFSRFDSLNRQWSPILPSPNPHCSQLLHFSNSLLLFLSLSRKISIFWRKSGGWNCLFLWLISSCYKHIDFDFFFSGVDMAEVAKVLYIVVVDEKDKREKGKESFRYTRPVLQSTLQLMGCKARHAFKAKTFSFSFFLSFLPIFLRFYEDWSLDWKSRFDSA